MMAKGKGLEKTGGKGVQSPVGGASWLWWWEGHSPLGKGDGEGGAGDLKRGSRKLRWFLPNGFYFLSEVGHRVFGGKRNKRIGLSELM